MSTMYACGCGEWAGERCCWEGPPSEMVVVEYMPECHRDSHTAARNSGSWPHNGSVRVACHPECADRVVEADGPEWAGVVAADPADYAEEAHPEAAPVATAERHGWRRVPYLDRGHDLAMDRDGLTIYVSARTGTVSARTGTVSAR